MARSLASLRVRAMHRFRLAPALGLLACILCAVPGCTQQSRLFRISPFSDEAGRDRVNLWPLLYSAGGSTAVLWPLIDFDARGYAVRPLLARDGDEFQVLFPWSSLDLRTGHGWAAPYYHFEGHQGIFPVAHFGDLNYIGLLWWQRREGSGDVESGGLFPVILLGKTGYVGPLWWSGEGGRLGSGGLFPLGMFGSLNYIGPVWWTSGEGTQGSIGFFPLFARGSFQQIGPLWWKNDAGGDRTAAGFFPLVWSNADASELTVLPFYHQDLGETSELRQYLLGLGHFQHQPESHTRWVLPFWIDHQDPDGGFELVLPLFLRVQQGAGSHVFTLLGDRHVEGTESGFNLYPFYWSWGNAHSSTRMLLPFFLDQREGARRTFITALGGFALDPSGQAEFVNLFGPLFHHSSAPNESRWALLWPLIERHREGDRVSTRVFPVFGLQETSDRSEAWILGGLSHWRTEASGSSFRLWPLFSHSTARDVPGWLYHLSLVRSHQTGSASEFHLFPLFDVERRGDLYQSSWLLGTGHSREWGGDSSLRQWPLFSFHRGDSLPGLFHYLSLWGRRQTSSGVQAHVGTPAGLWWETSTEGWSGRWLGLFTAHDERFPDPVIPDSKGTAESEQVRDNRISSAGVGFLFDWFCSRHERYRKWRLDLPADDRLALARYQQARMDPELLRPVLQGHGVAPAGDVPVEARDVVDFAAVHTREVDHWHHRLPLLFEYESDDDKTEWDVLLWALHSREQRGESDFRLLYYLYRSHSEGDRTRRDLFPFITWDTDAGGFEFSFFWRLFRLERRAGELSGHALFLPF